MGKLNESQVMILEAEIDYQRGILNKMQLREREIIESKKMLLVNILELRRMLYQGEANV